MFLYVLIFFLRAITYKIRRDTVCIKRDLNLSKPSDIKIDPKKQIKNTKMHLAALSFALIVAATPALTQGEKTVVALSGVRTKN